jgi:YidC/Oxa1 family membrane protein insertase
MNIFELLIVQPIFNLLLFIFNFVGDFGIAIIILTIIIRFILWPLVRKQLRQTKMMREIQPELKRIKTKAKGNKMLESQLMMELYKEKGVKPMSSILVLIIQLPIFIAIFQVIRMFTYNPAAGQTIEQMSEQLHKFAYPFMEHLDRASQVINDPNTFSPHLLGLVDLTRFALSPTIYVPLIIVALLAAGLQFWQSRQTMPRPTEKRKLREYFKDAAAGKEVDQSEMTASMSRGMMYLFPIMTLVIAVNLPGAVVLYYAVQAAVAVGQQAFILNRDKKTLESEADAPAIASKATANKVKNAKEAVIVKKSDLKKPIEKSGSGGKTVVRRIKAK